MRVRIQPSRGIRDGVMLVIGTFQEVQRASGVFRVLKGVSNVSRKDAKTQRAEKGSSSCGSPTLKLDAICRDQNPAFSPIFQDLP